MSGRLTMRSVAKLIKKMDTAATIFRICLLTSGVLADEGSVGEEVEISWGDRRVMRPIWEDGLGEVGEIMGGGGASTNKTTSPWMTFGVGGGPWSSLGIFFFQKEGMEEAIEVKTDGENQFLKVVILD